VDVELRELFQRHHFVGFYSNYLCIIQSDTFAYILNWKEILKELFYQMIVFSFGNMGSYKLISEDADTNSESLLKLHISSLLSLYFATEIGAPSRNDRIDELCDNLTVNRCFLWDYFCVEIIPQTSEQGGPLLGSLPCLIDGFLPQTSSIILLLYELSTLDFSKEEECYHKVAFALAKFYVPDIDESHDEELGECDERTKTTLRNLVFPCLKNKFLPSKTLRSFVKKLTSTQEAFKKFGRC